MGISERERYILYRVIVHDNKAQRCEFGTLTQTDKYQRQNEFGHVVQRRSTTKIVNYWVYSKNWRRRLWYTCIIQWGTRLRKKGTVWRWRNAKADENETSSRLYSQTFVEVLLSVYCLALFATATTRPTEEWGAYTVNGYSKIYEKCWLLYYRLYYCRVAEGKDTEAAVVEWKATGKKYV